MDTSSIESSLKCISRASLRTANYLDGCKVTTFVELDLLPGKSLENDLSKTIGQAESPVVSREDLMKKSFGKGADHNADA